MSLPLPEAHVSRPAYLYNEDGEICGHAAPLLSYTPKQMHTYGQACRAAALEEAAQVCSHKAETKRLFLNEAHYLECAEAIRRLI